MDWLRNRWVRSAIIPFAIYFCTTWYYNSPILYLHLVKEGTYSWKCDECDSGHPGWDAARRVCINQSNAEAVICPKQGDAISKIFNIASSMEFTGSFFAGLLFDLVGYRISLLSGYIMWNIGYYCVMFSTRSVQLYYLGAMMGGLAVNITAFPALYIKEFFPGHENESMIPNFCAQWAGSTVMKVLMMMEESGLSFQTGALIYGLLGIPFVTAFYFTLPKDRPELLNQLRDEGRLIIKDERKATYKDIITTLKQWDVPVFSCVVYTPLMLCANIYQVVLPAIAKSDVTNIVGDIQLLMPVFCLIYGAWGLLGNKAYITWTPFVIAFVGTLVALITLLFPDGSRTIQIVGGAIFYVSFSYSAVTKYTFTSQIIDNAVFGTICGLTGTFEGLMQLLNMEWKSLALYNPRGLIIGFCVVITISSILLVILIIRIYAGKLDYLKHIVTPKEEELSVGEEEKEIAKLEGTDNSEGEIAKLEDTDNDG